MVHASSLSTREAEASESLRSIPACSIEQPVSEQPELHRETLPRKTKTERKRKGKGRGKKGKQKMKEKKRKEKKGKGRRGILNARGLLRGHTLECFLKVITIEDKVLVVG